MESELSSVVDVLPGLVWTALPDGRVDLVNRAWCEYAGMDLDTARDEGWLAMVHPDDLPGLLERWHITVASGKPNDMQARLRGADGAYRSFALRVRPVLDAAGRVVKWSGLNHCTDQGTCPAPPTQVTDFCAIADGPAGSSLTVMPDSKLARTLLAGEKQLLEMVARGCPRPDILEAFCRLVEDTIAGSQCSIMLMDATGARMEIGVGPNLPESFVARITGCFIDNQGGPCPMAVRLNEQIIANDLATETRWVATRWPAMAMSHGLRACWSMPVVAASGESMGVFAVYSDRPRSPSAQDLALIDQLTHIASVTIERLRSQMSLAQAFQEIRASEDRLRNIIHTVPGFVWSAAPDGSVDFLNQRWAEYTGMALVDARGTGWTSAVHPDDAAALITYWQTLLASGKAGQHEARLRRYDGVYRWFLIKAVPQYNESDRLVKWYGANTDIEDRKQAEMLLAGEKQLLGMMAGGASLAPILDEVCRLIETILDGALCSIVLIDPKRSPLQRDGASVLHLQHGAAPHVPAALLENIVGRVADADANPVALAALSHAAVISTDLTLETRWEAWRSTALSQGIRSNWSTPITSGSGKVAGILTIQYRQAKAFGPMHQGLIARFAHLANISIECARWEAALRQSEAFLTKAQRLSLTGTFSWRVHADEIIWSEEIYRICEVDPGVKPTFEVIYTRIHPDDIPALDEVLKRQRVEARDFEHEHRLLMPDGRVKHVNLVAHATQDEDGGLEYIAALQDITQRRFSEEALSKVRSELTHVARVASLGALTASIAHEVNQPLAGIITNANTCLRMLAADPPNVDGARETARRTIRDGNRASEVIQRLRALFAKKGVSAERVDLNEATREVAAMLLGELQRNSVILQPEFAENLPPAKGDRVQLQQVILNLIVNASDAMRTVTDRPHHLRVSTGQDENGHVWLTVRDSGTGFDPQDVERLFHAFHTTKSAGMGIGLSVSRSIIESHDGRLWAVANDDEPGASFSFAIPAWSESEAFDRNDYAVEMDAPTDAGGAMEVP